MNTGVHGPPVNRVGRVLEDESQESGIRPGEIRKVEALSFYKDDEVQERC